MFGSESGTPIISRPQVAVLALGNILRRAWIIEENGKKKYCLNQYDFVFVMTRIVDGALPLKIRIRIKKIWKILLKFYK